MKKLLLIISIVFLSNTLYSQSTYQDVIHLKNGDMVKGIIIENVPNDYIKIELLGGSILTYSYQEIIKFAKEKINEKTPPSPTNIIMQQQQQQQTPVQTIPVQSTNTDLAKAQKLAMYENQKKSPGTARVLSFLLSSAGHAYAGNWGRGLLFLVGRMAFLGLAISGTNEENSNSVSSGGTQYNLQSDEKAKSKVTIGVIGMVAIAIWEIVDAGNETEKHNEELYNSIFNNVPNFGMNISPMDKIGSIPINDGMQLNLTYQF